MKKRISDFFKNNSTGILVVVAIIFEILLYILTPYVERIIVHICTIIIISSLSVYMLLNNKKDFKKNLFLLIFIIGILLRTIYIFKTNIYERQHDVLKIFEEGHLDYIYILFTTHRLPTTNIWQFYHPPLWHLLGAIWLEINNYFKVGLDYALEGLQVLSLLFSLFVLVVVNKICIKLKMKDKYRNIVDLFFATHLTLMMLGGSVNNDCLLLFLESLVILSLINFYEDDNWKNTICLAIVTGLCVMTKINGAIMAIPIMYIFIRNIIKYFKEGSIVLKNYIKKIIVFGLISLPIGLWFQVRNLFLFGTTVVPRPGDWLYTGDHSILSRFFTINIYELFQYANMDTDYNLPAFIIKSSLFGEFAFDKIIILKNILMILNVILIIFSMIFIIKYLVKDRKNVIINILFITWLSFMVSTYIFNYNYAYACSMDFRYIAVCLLPGIIILGHQLQDVKNKYLNIFIQIMCYLFGIVSAIFITIF